MRLRGLTPEDIFAGRRDRLSPEDEPVRQPCEEFVGPDPCELEAGHDGQHQTSAWAGGRVIMEWDRVDYPSHRRAA